MKHDSRTLLDPELSSGACVRWCDNWIRRRTTATRTSQYFNKQGKER